MICPSCGETLISELQYTAPCFIHFSCSCGYKSTFECSIYPDQTTDVTQEMINEDHQRTVNPKGRYKLKGKT